MLNAVKIKESIHMNSAISSPMASIASADPEGGTGGPDPPGKSQVIWVSIGNKQLDPPPPGKCWTPSGTLKNDSFLRN